SEHGPSRIRTYNQPVMRPTAAFAAPFEFVGRTLSSSPAGCLPSSLYTFVSRRDAWLGITLSDDVGFPEFDRMLYSVSAVEAPCTPPYPVEAERRRPALSRALCR